MRAFSAVVAVSWRKTLNKKWLLGLFASLMFSQSAYANNFNYNFLEFRTATDPKFSGVEFNTLVLQNVHFIARVDSQFEGDADIATGFGFNGPINQFADVFGQALVHSISYPDEQGKDRETLGEFNIGLRVWLSNQIEATTRFGKLDENSVFHAGLRFHSTDQLSLAAETRNSGIYGPQLSLSVRFQF